MTDWTEWSECSHRCGQRAKLCATCGPNRCLDLGHFVSDSFTKAEANMRTMSRESLKASKHILHIAAHCCTTCNAKTVSVCERDWKRLLDATGCPWILLDATGNVLGMYWCHLAILTSFMEKRWETIKLLDLSSTEAWGDGSNKRSYAGWKLLDSQNCKINLMLSDL